MLIKGIEFLGYGPFKDLQIPLWSTENPNQKITVLIGENGAGKSAFLEGIVTLLSWFTARVRNEKSNGTPIPYLKINNSNVDSSIQLELTAEEQNFAWQLAQTIPGKRGSKKTNLRDVVSLASIFSQKYTTDNLSSLPMIAHYPAERYVLETPQRNRNIQTYTQINGYVDSFAKTIDFEQFFSWLREREDIQNEMKIGIQEVVQFIDHMKFSKFYEENKKGDEGVSLDEIFSLLDEEKLKKENPSLFVKVQNRENDFFDAQFAAVTRAIENFMPNYVNLRIERRLTMRMLIDKDGQPFDILQLSQGERSLLALVGDIARRLAIMNPALDDPLQGEGIILIDEVDLHLHPRWQRSIVRNLKKTFPNCQFILTTHSPLVISDPDNIQVLALRNGTIEELPNLYGMDVEQVFLEIMNTPLRHEELQEKIDDLLDAIQDKELAKAKELRKELSKILPPDHRELVRADIFLRRQEALHAKDK